MFISKQIDDGLRFFYRKKKNSICLHLTYIFFLSVACEIEVSWKKNK